MPVEESGVREYLKSLAVRLDAAGHGNCGELLASAQTFLGWSRSRLYRQLKQQAGWVSGRSTRSDKGRTRQNEQSLEMLAALKKEAIRKNGKETLHTPTAASLVQVNGSEISVSPSRLNRLLKDRKLDTASQTRASAHTTMRAEHPNHVHQVDPSLCLIFYMPNGEQRIMRDDEFYKNKLENVAKIKLKVWRYVLWDGASSAIIPWYVEAAGETQHNLFQFLMFAWGQQPGRPFHGVPRMMVWDKGSANGAHAIKNLLKALQVEEYSHAKGNARAKGGVEGANNLVETHFECRLRFQPVSNVEELNAAACAWANAYNADLIPNFDARLHRVGLPRPMARYDLWLKITQEQLRVLPSLEVCQALMEGKCIERKVGPNLKVSFRHPQAPRTLEYDVAHLPGVCVGDMVEVSPLVYGDWPIVIRVARYDGAPLEYTVTPETQYDDFGQPMSAATWGEEFKSRPDTAAETQGKKLDRLAYPNRELEEITKARDKNETPFEGKLDALDHLNKIDMPAYLARRGSEITVPQRVQIEIKPLNLNQAAMRLRTLLGRPVTAEDRQNITAWYPDGVMEEQLQEAADRLEGKYGRPGLRLVG
jgi:hypothetical protein